MTMKTSEVRSFMRSLPILASVLGKKLGVKVQIGGLACTDGKTIYLPPLPLDGGEELFILANGFLDHEAAHVRETDFGELLASGLSPLGHTLFNLAEDVRVERELAGIYPGCREHFKKMYRILTKDVTLDDSNQVAKNIICWLLSVIFQEQYPDVDFRSGEFGDALSSQFPSLILQLEQFIQPCLACASTRESIKWGQSVEHFLQQYFKKSKPQESDQAQPSSDGEPKAGDGNDGSEPSDSQQSEGKGQGDGESGDIGAENRDDHGYEPMADPASDDAPEFDGQDADESGGEGDMPPSDFGQEIEQPEQPGSSTGTGEDAGGSEADMDSGDIDSSDSEQSSMGDTEAGSEPAEADSDTGNDPGMCASGTGSAPGQGDSDSEAAPDIGDEMLGSGESTADASTGQTQPLGTDATGIDMLDHLIQGANADELAEEVREALGAMVNSDGEMPQTLGDVLKQILEQISQETSSSGHLQVAVVKGVLPGEMPKPLIEQAQSATKVMATRLSGLLQTQTLTRSHTGRRGRVDGPRLHRLAVQNPRVFQQPGEKQSVDTAVHILLDCSSSMDECMSLANAACFSVASSLRRIRGVNVGVTAFPGIWDEDEPGTVAPILRHGQRMHTRFAVRSFGSTPMGEAVWWTCQELMPLKEERKIILLLTDGYPDSLPNAEAALEAARTMGIEIIGIGIGQYGEFILKLVENSRVINEIEELAPAMFGVLQQALTEKRQQ